jgi:hypothetical protein
MNMNVNMFIDMIHKSCGVELSCIILIANDAIGIGRSNYLSTRAQILVAGLHIILMMLFKSRAAYHCRIHKQIATGNGNFNYLWMHLKETIQCGPKMAPSSNPVLSGIGRVLCHLVVWKLFPRPFALLYTSIAWMSHVIQWLIAASLCDSIDGRKYVTYDGRRFKINWTGFEYSKIQDTDQNVLYYPTIDLYRLLPSDVDK